MKNARLTPMMAQWHEAKQKYPDSILFFRMGDFYELFAEDAVKAAPLLDLVLTSRDKDKSGVKMAGFPHHSADGYIKKLCEYGIKVAVCEQLEDPKKTKKLVERGVTEVITPTTFLENDSSSFSGQWLLALTMDKKTYTISALNLTSAEFITTSSNNVDLIKQEIIRLDPKECLVNPKEKEPIVIIGEYIKKFQHHARKEFLDVGHNFSSSLDNINRSSIMILEYVRALKKTFASEILTPRFYSLESKLLIDDATRDNLHIFPKKNKDDSCLWHLLDCLKTQMGKRLLYESLAAPYTCKKKIECDLDLLQAFYDDKPLQANTADLLQNIGDLPKLISLAASKKINPRNLGVLSNSLQACGELKNLLGTSSNKNIENLLSTFPSLQVLLNNLDKALVQDPPFLLRDGGIFKEGYNTELDKLLNIDSDAQDEIASIESKERESTNIGSLKVKYTKVFGYYIEVTKTHLAKVPAHYQRKQTVANGERYIIPELLALETKILEAQEKILFLEQKLFFKLVEEVVQSSHSILALASIIAKIDKSCSLAKISLDNNYVRPTIVDDESYLHIEEGRHPVVEQKLKEKGEYFVPNDSVMSHEAMRIQLISGPNMAGKSTIMRQVAILQLMAQAGIFVPAKSASFSICDSLFARVGAHDDISKGRSTFMVEMSETAYILSCATNKSLILLDEIGRGTSTYDGLAIAIAVSEYLHDVIKARVLFATHYHELCELEKYLPHLKNYHASIDESNGDVKFLYKLSQGFLNKSYGIHVAKLAGLPFSVVNRAKKSLRELEEIKSGNKSVQKALDTTLFDFNEKKLPPLEEELLKLNIDEVTPVEALLTLSKWQKLYKS